MQQIRQNRRIERNKQIKQKEINMKANQRICPLDGKPCEKDCPDRYQNDPQGGCILNAYIDACEDAYREKQTKR